MSVQEEELFVTVLFQELNFWLTIIHKNTLSLQAECSTRGVFLFNQPSCFLLTLNFEPIQPIRDPVIFDAMKRTGSKIVLKSRPFLDFVDVEIP